ncbi:MAG: glycosyltransferase family 4 protein [Phycisphaerae bacterium]|nr:glycosyltransferase family 4 protein [Phycisphaerae bacterium]
MTTRRGGSILFLTPAFLADRRHKRVHGVEIFNSLFIRRLLELGHPVTLPIEPRWSTPLREHLPEHPALEVVPGLPLRRPLPVSLALVPSLRRRGPFDLLILGNNGRGILPAARLLRAGSGAKRTVLFAHQFPRPDYLRAIARMGIPVHAVSHAVGDAFKAGGVREVNVSYGVLSAERFHPRAGDRPPGPLRFGVVGQLDTPWKGAHLALDAWRMLPDRLRGRVELHLLAYRHPPPDPPPGAVPHEWLPPGGVADFLRTLDALIVPSTSAETFSQVTVQAMLTGLPILAYDLPVLAEKLDAGGGAVFRSAAELAALVERLHDDEPARAAMGDAARATALQRYVWRAEEFVERYLSPVTG